MFGHLLMRHYLLVWERRNGDQLGGDINYSQGIIQILSICILTEHQQAPVVAGSVALFLESKPDATSGEVRIL